GELGRAVNVLLEREAVGVVGLAVVCGDEVHRFHPLPTAAIGEGALTIHAPLGLLEGDQLDFYRSRSFVLRLLRGQAVLRKGKAAGRLRDIVFAADGGLRAVVLEPGGRLPFDDSLQFAPQSRTAA